MLPKTLTCLPEPHDNATDQAFCLQFCHIMQVIVISWIQFTMHQSRYRSPEESSDLLPARCKETYFVIAQVPHVLGMLANAIAAAMHHDVVSIPLMLYTTRRALQDRQLLIRRTIPSRYPAKIVCHVNALYSNDTVIHRKMVQQLPDPCTRAFHVAVLYSNACYHWYIPAFLTMFVAARHCYNGWHIRIYAEVVSLFPEHFWPPSKPAALKSTRTGDKAERGHFVHTQMVPSFASTRSTHNHLQGCRIGEAKNPGPVPPNSHTVNLGLVNPTAILNKQEALKNLGCGILTCSENSATKTTQHIMNSSLRQLGFTQVWSPPVAAHLSTQREEGARRGMASGVSCHSIYPIRASRVTINPELDPTRIVSSIVQIGSWALHLIVIYGYPSCLPQSRTKTEALLQEAARLESVIRLPTIICGDFNHHPRYLNTAQTLSALRYQTTEEIHLQLYGKPMPKTCRGKTCHDQMLIHPTLVPLVISVQVNQEKTFHDHDPVIIQLQFPMEQPTYYTWTMPAPFFPYEPNPTYVANHFDALTRDSPLDSRKVAQSEDLTLSDALQLWARTCETAVHRTLNQQHAEKPETYPQKGLPKKCFGRMKQRKLCRVPITPPIPQACEGQYNPPTETSTYRVLQNTKQIRRLQSLRQRIIKTADPNHTQDLGDLQKEWIAIMGSKGFGNFPKWCLNKPELAYLPYGLPPTDFLDIAIDLLKHETDALSNQLNLHRQRTARFTIWYDQKHGYLKNTMKKIKANSHPMLQSMKSELTTNASLMNQNDGLIELRFEHPDGFNLQSPIQYGDYEIIPQHFDADVCTGMMQDADQILPSHAIATQSTISQQPEVVAYELQQYWNQFWRRDSVADFDNPQHWNQFLELLQQHPNLPSINIDVSRADSWRDALRKTNAGKARGYDGWHIEDLKTLPDTCLQCLANIFHHKIEENSFPAFLMQNITLPMGKKPDSDHPSSTRPITLLPIVYRLLAKVVCTQVLCQWRDNIPKEVIGFLPGRNPHSSMLEFQFQLEQSLSHQDVWFGHWQGITLDLVKCFNLLPRFPCRMAMLKCGIPLKWVDFWYKSLMVSTRWWRIGPGIYRGGLSTTGTPEGDTWSVLACIAVSTFWVLQLKAHGAQPSAFADNWGWRTRRTEHNLLALAATTQFIDMLRIQIDWSKTWGWNTNNRDKDMWMTTMLQATPLELYCI